MTIHNWGFPEANLPTKKQIDLIESMNEFCDEKLDLTTATREDATIYIRNNYQEFKLASMDDWAIINGYF